MFVFYMPVKLVPERKDATQFSRRLWLHSMLPYGTLSFTGAGAVTGSETHKAKERRPVFGYDTVLLLATCGS